MTDKWNSGTDLPSVVENVQTMTGQRGDGSSKIITADQLVALGLALKKTSASTGKVTLTPPTSFPGAPDTKVSYPTKPTGFMVESAFSFVVLIWDMPKYAGHSLTEIYRNAEDNLANAVLVGTEAAGVYSDAQNTGQAGYYYWIRHVNANGVPGPYNATAGTYGQTDPNAAQNLIADRVVAGIEIDTPLIRSANIQNGKFTVDENGNMVATNGTLNQVTANYGTFYYILVTGATIENTVIAADCTVLGTLYAEHIVGDIVNSQSGGISMPYPRFSWGESAGDHVMWGINGENFDRVLDSNMSLYMDSGGGRQIYSIIVRTDGQADQQISYFDTGNDGGTLTFPLNGITIPMAGRGNHNYLVVRLASNGGGVVNLTTPSNATSTIQIYKKGGVIAYSMDV